MAAAPVALATSGQAVKALTADLVVIEGRFFRKVKRRIPTGRLTPKGRPGMRTEITLEPIDVSAHVNPVSIVIGAAIGLFGIAIGAWWLGLGVHRKSDADLLLEGIGTVDVVTLEGNLITVDRDGIRDLILGDESRLRDIEAALDSNPSPSERVILLRRKKVLWEHLTMLREKQKEIEKELMEGVPWQRRYQLENRPRLS